MRLICGFSGFAAISEFPLLLCFQLNWVPLKFQCSQIHLFVMLVLTLTFESRCLTPVLFSNLFSGCICLPFFPVSSAYVFPGPLLFTLHFFILSPHIVFPMFVIINSMRSHFSFSIFQEVFVCHAWADFHSEFNSVWLSFFFFFFYPGSKVRVLCVRSESAIC